MKILVVATEPLDKSTADEIAGDAGHTDVFVVAPTVVDSKLGYWVSDTDDAQEQADETVRKSVANLSSTGTQAAGRAGDIDPTVAVDDALRTFDPDRILVIKHSEDSESYREDELLDHLNERVTIPIEVRQVPAQVHGD